MQLQGPEDDTVMTVQHAHTISPHQKNNNLDTCSSCTVILVKKYILPGRW